MRYRQSGKLSLSHGAAIIVTMLFVVVLVSANPSYALGGPSNSEQRGSAIAGLTVTAMGAQSEGHIPAGEYFIVRADALGMAIDVSSESKSMGTNVQLSEANNTKSQIWAIEYDAEGRCTIKNKDSGKTLQLAGKRIANGTNILQNDNSGTIEQKWYIERVSGGYCIASAENRSYVLDCKGAEKANGTNIQLYLRNDTAAQKFLFVNASVPIKNARTVPDGIYIISSTVASGKVLDVRGASRSNQANVQIYKSNSTMAQRWRVMYGADGYYTLQSMCSGKMLDVAGANKNPGGNIWQYSKNETAAQKWAIKDNGDGTYALVSACNGLAACVADDKNENGANIQTAVANQSNAQRFTFERVAEANDVGSVATQIGLIDGGVGGGVKVDTNGRSFTMSYEGRKNLNKAIEKAWHYGNDVGFIMIDVQTGMSISLDADRSFHGASTIKAAYVTYIFEELLEKGVVSLDSVRYLIEPTIIDSNNMTYMQLRSMYGTGGFSRWLNTVGLGYLAYESYPSFTARELATIWTKLYDYEESGGEYTWLWRKTFNHSFYSCIGASIDRHNTVYSKPGWVGALGGYAALNDAAIVVDGTGSKYILAILSDVDCYANPWIIHALADALDHAHREMVVSQ